MYCRCLWTTGLLESSTACTRWPTSRGRTRPMSSYPDFDHPKHRLSEEKVFAAEKADKTRGALPGLAQMLWRQAAEAEEIAAKEAKDPLTRGLLANSAIS